MTRQGLLKTALAAVGAWIAGVSRRSSFGPDVVAWEAGTGKCETAAYDCLIRPLGPGPDEGVVPTTVIIDRLTPGYALFVNRTERSLPCVVVAGDIVKLVPRS